MSHEALIQRLDALLEKYLSGIEQYSKYDDIIADLEFYREDPVYSLFGMASEAFIKLRYGAGFANACATNLGRFFEKAFKCILSESLSLDNSEISMTIPISVGSINETRETDGIIPIPKLDTANSTRISALLENYVSNSRYKDKSFSGLGYEVRVRYGKNDSKLLQADEHMAAELVERGYFPVMLIFSTSSYPNQIIRVSKAWDVRQGKASVEHIKQVTGFDLTEYLASRSARIEQFKAHILTKFLS